MNFITYSIKELMRHIKKLHIHNWECIDIFDSSNYNIPEGRSIEIYKCCKCGKYRYSNIGIIDWLDKEMLRIDESDYLSIKESSNKYMTLLKRREDIEKLKEESKRIVYKRPLISIGYRRRYGIWIW